MNICVFCGSSTGNIPEFSNAARGLGKLIAQSGHSLVYGAGNIGLMGVIADTVLEFGGKVIGVIPDFLVRREVCHQGLSELIIVKSMHERKQTMADRSDVFIAMPGGWGTLDELAEILTWKQLGLIARPVGILNTLNFFSPLLESMNSMTRFGFLKRQKLDQIAVSEHPSELFIALGVELKIEAFHS